MHLLAGPSWCWIPNLQRLSTDATTVSAVSNATSNSKACVCADGCDLFAATSDGDGYTYAIPDASDKTDTAIARRGLYNLREDLSCSVPETICAKLK